MSKPKLPPTRPLIDAGYRPSALHHEGLPFDPHDFRVKKDLPAALAGITDIDVLNRMQAFDTRNSAAAEYERRIDDITASAEGVTDG